MLRLMLNAHPQMRNPGEIDGIFDHLHQSDDGRWVFDFDGAEKDWLFRHFDLPVSGDPDGLAVINHFFKLLASRDRAAGENSTHTSYNVHRNFDKIIALFPNAKFVHLLRDPRDVARSSIAMGWAGTTYHGVRHWIETEELWDRAADRIEPSQALQMTFEDLICDPAGRLSEICAFFGVSYSEKMLDYPQTTTYSPPDPSLIEQWRRKMTMRETALVEIRAKDLMTKRGYELSGAELVPPGFTERLNLRFTDIQKRVALSVKRFGLIDTVLEIASRRLRLSHMHQSVQRRIDKKRVKYIK